MQYHVIQGVKENDLEKVLNVAVADGWDVFQVLPTLAFETKRVAFSVDVILPKEILSNVILRKA